MKLTTYLQRKLHLRRDYRSVFLDEQGNLTEAGAAVLADLAHFARVNKSIAVKSPITHMVDTHATMINGGKRDVLNRIMQYLNVTESQIYALMEREYGNPEP